MLRDSLGEHDRGLLTAIGPWVAVPQDALEVERRLVALTASHRDADYLYQLCRFRVLNGNYNGAAESCRATRDIDGAFAGAYWLEAQSHLYLDDTRGGIPALDACLRLSPAATSCINDMFHVRTNEGVCGAALGYAEKLVAAEPNNARWLEQLGIVSYSMDKPIATAQVALDRFADLSPARLAPITRARGHFKLAILTGDFAASRAQLELWERAVDGTGEEFLHHEALRIRALLERETGQSAKTIDAARAFLARHAAWIPTSESDGRIEALVALYRGGALTRAQFISARNAWLAEMHQRTRTPGRFGAVSGREWIAAYADAAITPEDARAALATLPDYRPLPADQFRDIEDDEAIGATFLVAGQPAVATTFLRRAAHSCEAARFPFHHTWANLELGEALESSDVRGACEAYQVVLDRWATAAVSRSAHLAYVRRKALGCQ